MTGRDYDARREGDPVFVYDARFTGPLWMGEPVLRFRGDNLTEARWHAELCARDSGVRVVNVKRVQGMGRYDRI